MAFIESPRFPENISYGAKVSTAYNTSVARNFGGYESRNINWQNALRRLEVSYIKNKADMDALVAFFHAVAQGRGNTFRIKDWTDYQVATSDGKLGTGVGTGAPTYQLRKRYTSGANTRDRDVKKPVAGAALYRNAALQTLTTHYTLDTTSGVITFVADVSKVITAITKANPGKVTTSTAHGFSTGNVIWISGVGGMTQVNSLAFTITVVDTTNFTIGVNTTNYSTYTSGGAAAKYPQPADALTWSGEFDVPGRFDTDSLDITHDDRGIYVASAIPIVEVRI